MSIDIGETTGPGSFFGNRLKLRLVLSLCLFMVTTALYSPITRAPFFNYDDDAYVIENPHVRAGLTRATLSWAFTTTAEANWHPITWLSHALDVQLFDMNPAGPHFVNVLFHSANVVLIFLLLETATRFAWRSFAVALLFAIHPINVESVAWISERKNVLSMFFFLLAIGTYAWYAKRPQWRRGLLVSALFALALMSKPQVITFPFLLLLLDYWPLGRLRLPKDKAQDSVNVLGGPTATLTSLLVEKIPLFLMCAASAMITLRVQTTAMYQALPFSTKLGNAVIAYVKYIARAFWPADLAPLYPHPGHVDPFAAVAAAMLLLTITGLVLWHRNPYLWAGWFWFLGSFVPMIGLVQVGVQSMADRYAYIPFLGLFTMVIWGIADLIAGKEMPKLLYVASASVVAILLAWACHIQIGYWGDNLNIWNHTLQVTQNNFIAEDSIATALLMRGQPDEAAAHLRNAVRINPDDPFAELNLGVYEQQQGDYRSALRRLESIPAITADPRVRATALANAGFIHYTLKNYDAAKRCFENALGQRSETPQALIGLGLLAQRDQDMPRAIQFYARAADLQTTPVSLLLLAQALDVGGHSDSARIVRDKAALMAPNLDEATRVTQDLLNN